MNLRLSWYVSVRRTWYVSVRRAWCVALLTAACRPAAPASAVFVAPAEAISFLGDTLKQPRLDSTARTRMEADLARARADAAARPSDSDALIWVGRRLAYLGRYREAIDVFSEGIRRFPNDPRMYRHRGHRYISVRELDAAIRDFDKAVALMRGRPDEVEPDGQPNARGIPIGSLQSNVWYHLALAHYLKGDWDQAAHAARSGVQISNNPDRLVSQTHWLYMALRRAGRNADAAAALAPIKDDFDVIENQSYYRLVKLYKTGVPAVLLDSVLGSDAATPSDASFAYGAANWALYNGDTTRAVRTFERLLTGGSWASFGYIAAEADLARLRNRNRR
jgi:tetratricopeptide (TPR) repeat protein